MSEILKSRQENDALNEDVRSLLNEEVQLFRTVFQETSEFVRDLDRFSLKRLTQLLQSRKQWIDELKHLETRFQYLNYPSPDDFKTEITQILNALVLIDAQLLDFLKMRKQAIIKELVQITDNRNRSPNRCSLKDGPRVIDLMQE